jgi:hypothetical protein
VISRTRARLGGLGGLLGQRGGSENGRYVASAPRPHRSNASYQHPLRFRPLIAVAILEKFGYVTTLSVLYALGQIRPGQFVVAGPDAILGLLFVAALVKTSPGRVAGAS